MYVLDHGPKLKRYYAAIISFFYWAIIEWTRNLIISIYFNWFWWYKQTAWTLNQTFIATAIKCSKNQNPLQPLIHGLVSFFVVIKRPARSVTWTQKADQFSLLLHALIKGRSARRWQKASSVHKIRYFRATGPVNRA